MTQHDPQTLAGRRRTRSPGEVGRPLKSKQFVSAMLWAMPSQFS